MPDGNISGTLLVNDLCRQGLLNPLSRLRSTAAGQDRRNGPHPISRDIAGCGERSPKTSLASPSFGAIVELGPKSANRLRQATGGH